MRDSSIFYRRFYEAIKTLPEVNQIEVYNAIFEYSFNYVEVELYGLSNTIFMLIKPQLMANNKRFENGSKAKNKQTKSKMEAKCKQSASKQKANNNNNVDNINENILSVEPATNKNIEERKKLFYDSLKPFLNTYHKEMMRNFYNYWSEPNKSKTKMRFELQKTWELNLRLSNWANNNKEFNGILKINQDDNITITQKVLS